MTWRSWLRVLIFAILISLCVSVIIAGFQYQVAVSVTRERYFEARYELLMRMIQAERSTDEIRRALANLERRYGQEHERTTEDNAHR